MNTLTYIIAIVGLIMIRWNDKKAEYKRYMRAQEISALEENFRRTEKQIKILHSHGKIFGNSEDK